MARDAKVASMVSPDLKRRLQEWAVRYGTTESTLVSLIIGQWIYQQDAIYGKALDVLSGPQIASIVNGIVAQSEGAGADRA